MCGIAGFAGIPIPENEAAARVRAMCDAIVHRGPDSDGYHVADGVALGMRRLSIIDVSGGRQPISNEDGSITVVFNGEIYNHQRLRRELEARGHRFATHSDTEVLVHLYEDLGPEMATRLHGMFAFAIWGANSGSLLLARDRTGMKPLNYMLMPQGLVFCSELRSLWVHHSDRLRISPSAVMQYLAFGYISHPASIFEGVRKLPPGHLLLWSKRKGTELRRYWAPPHPEGPAIDETELVQTLRAKLDTAVASHLESEVPLGAFLSGGLDSSTVVALMNRHASGRVRTFSIGFAEEQYDESAAARAVAAELGTDHTELIVRPNVSDIFDAIAAMFDEPFSDSSAIPMFLVAQLARQSVTVALSGDGGDELFGGYTRYGKILGSKAGGGRGLRHLLSALGLMMPHIFPGRNRLVDLGRSTWGRYTATVVEPLRLDEGGVARADQPGAAAYVADQLRDRIPSDLADDFAAAIMQLDLETYLPGDILTKVDRTSMAVSLEARVPLLDFDLVDFALQIPGSWRVTANESKRLFRRAIQGIVPDSVLSRPKQGFEVPLGRWFRGALRHRIEALRNPSPELRQYVDVDAIRRLVFEHGIGRRDHSAILWRLIVLDRWLAALKEGRLGRPPAIPTMPALQVEARKSLVK
jgi:asparagine synthase (glutamine-hydrolysing)